jgi:hypothetical protein
MNYFFFLHAPKEILFFILTLEKEISIENLILFVFSMLNLFIFSFHLND